MLTCYGHGPSNATASARAPTDDACLWFDLLDPDAAEQRRVEQAIGVALPTRERIGSVELSVRAAVDGDALRLNVPHFSHDAKGPPTPLGLILTPTHLVTLRYAQAPEFARAAQTLDKACAPASGVDAFAALVETEVGCVADRLENIAADVGAFSARLFGPRQRRTGPLRALLGEVGLAESRLAHARLLATGFLRIVMFAHDSGVTWIGKSHLARLKTAQKDLELLSELDSQLTDKLQFLLDAALGFISIEQNDVMKVFTVASVAAIPPVILVGVWGMNFQYMPELHGHYSYPIALGVIVTSILVPMLWFKRRGWF